MAFADGWCLGVVDGQRGCGRIDGLSGPSPGVDDMQTRTGFHLRPALLYSLYLSPTPFLWLFQHRIV